MSMVNDRPAPTARPSSSSARSGERVAMSQGDADSDAMPRRLDMILRALPDAELGSLIARMGIQIDPGKRIDTPSQVARALVGIPDVRDPARLAASSRELLHRIAEGGGSLVVPSLPAGLEPLLGRGVVFARKVDHGIELVLPTAFLLQLKSWEGRTRAPCAPCSRRPRSRPCRRSRRSTSAGPRRRRSPSRSSPRGRASATRRGSRRRSRSCRPWSAGSSSPSRPSAARSTRRSCSTSSASRSACAARAASRRPAAARASRSSAAPSSSRSTPTGT